MRKCEGVVYAKRPFAGPAAVLTYLSRYTHRVAISNTRLIAMDMRGVTFRWKDYRAKGHTRYKAMTLGADEFMRRFLLHTLLMDALWRSLDAAAQIAAMAVVVDAKDKAAKAFYAHFGFTPLRQRPARMFSPMKTVASLFP